MDGADGGEQPHPGVVAALQQLLAVSRQRLKLGQQHAHRVVPHIDLVLGQQHPLLLRREQEDQAHHHGQGRLVDHLLDGAPGERRVSLDGRGEGAAALVVGGVNRGHQQLDRLTHLKAELVGQLLLVAGAGREQRLDGLVFRPPKEHMRAEQTGEGAQSQRLLQPEPGVPRDQAGGLAPGRIHEQPLLAIGDQAKAHARAVEQGHHARGQRLPPAGALGRAVEGLAWSDDAHQHAGAIAPRLDNHHVGGQGLALLGHLHDEGGQITLGAGDRRIGEQEYAAQHPAHPRLVDRRVSLGADPLAVGQAQLVAHLAAHPVEALREGAVEHRQREEGAGDLQEREPLGM